MLSSQCQQPPLPSGLQLYAALHCWAPTFLVCRPAGQPHWYSCRRVAHMAFTLTATGGLDKGKPPGAHSNWTEQHDGKRCFPRGVMTEGSA